MTQPLLGTYPKKTIIQKDSTHPSVHCSTLYNSQDMEATQVSINRGVDKEDVIHIHNGPLLSQKIKSEIVPFAEIWIDLETDIE